jgi:hypothetical protein
MEEASFTCYVHRKNGGFSVTQTRVSAHLCEVSRLEPPPEPGRNRTWFSIEKAKERLQEGRKPDYAAELSRVVDRAVARIQRQQRSDASLQPQGLPKITLIQELRAGHPKALEKR